MSNREVKKRDMTTSDAGTVVGIAWYRADQWARLHEVSVDGADLEPSYTAWEERAKRRL